MAKVVLERPQLAPGVRLHWDKVRERSVLLFPEGAVALNETAVHVLELCDGERSVEEIAATLSERYSGADDLVTPPADAEIIKAGTKGARLEVIPDSAHNLTTERPSEVNAAVEKFLASLS